MPIARIDRRANAGRDGVHTQPIRDALTVSLFLALVIGAFLAARRLSGALTTPLAAPQLIITAALLVAWALAVRTLVPHVYINFSTTLTLALFAVGCSFPGERTVDWLVWLPVFGTLLASHGVATLSPAKQHPPATSGDQVLQELRRTRSADGRVTLHGTLIAEFAPGERTATLHVAFCPPFERLPHIEIESAAEAKVVQSLHQGAQIEVRLSRPAKNPTTATVELFATDAT